MGRAKDWCKHYNGTVNETCKAGVKYTDVKLLGESGPPSFPCFKDNNPLGATCEKCEFRTPEEVAEMERKQAERFEAIGKARGAIVAHLGGPWKKGTPGANGVIDCPACGKPGALHFSRAGYNGHIHARCQSAGCVNWME